MQVTLDMELPTGGARLHDAFEWDITCPDNCPQAFAQVLLEELSLASSDNVIAVTNEIRH